jgi:DNA-binding transcriptional LysR family regulator
MAPALAQFLERHPRVSLYLSLSDHCESFTDQGLDLAIRVAVLHDQNLTAARLGYVQRAVVGSRAYFNSHTPPAHPRDLRRHNCLHFTHYLRAEDWGFQEEGRPLVVKVRGRLRTNNQEALLDAVLAGTGLAVLPVWLVKEALEDGRLVRVLAEFERPRTPVHAVLPTRGPPPHKVHAFIEFLAARFRDRGVLAAERLVSGWSSR